MIMVWPLDATYMQKSPKVTQNGCLTLRKCLVARKRVVSVSCAFAHCSANGVTASRQSWQTSELILIVSVKESTSDLWEIKLWLKLPVASLENILTACMFQDFILL